MCIVRQALYHDSAFVKYYNIKLCTWEGKYFLLKLPDGGKRRHNLVYGCGYIGVYTSIKHWVEYVECVLKLCTCRTCTCIYIKTTISAMYVQTTALHLIYFVSQPIQSSNATHDTKVYIKKESTAHYVCTMYSFHSRLSCEAHHRTASQKLLNS